MGSEAVYKTAFAFLAATAGLGFAVAVTSMVWRGLVDVLKHYTHASYGFATLIAGIERVRARKARATELPFVALSKWIRLGAISRLGMHVASLLLALLLTPGVAAGAPRLVVIVIVHGVLGVAISKRCVTRLHTSLRNADRARERIEDAAGAEVNLDTAGELESVGDKAIERAWARYQTLLAGAVFNYLAEALIRDLDRHMEGSSLHRRMIDGIAHQYGDGYRDTHFGVPIMALSRRDSVKTPLDIYVAQLKRRFGIDGDGLSATDVLMLVAYGGVIGSAERGALGVTQILPDSMVDDLNRIVLRFRTPGGDRRRSPRTGRNAGKKFLWWHSRRVGGRLGDYLGSAQERVVEGGVVLREVNSSQHGALVVVSIRQWDRFEAFVRGENVEAPVSRPGRSDTVASDCVALEKRKRFRRIPGTLWPWFVYEVRISFQQATPTPDGTFSLRVVGKN